MSAALEYRPDCETSIRCGRCGDPAFDCECGGRVFKDGAVEVNPPQDNVIDLASSLYEYGVITPEEYYEIARQHIRKNLRPQDNILDYSKPMPVAELQQKLRELR